MLLLEHEHDVRAVLREERSRGKRIGLVPTMGALHEGHISLVRAVKPHCDYLVLWLFVNPTQFNSLSDYERYPRVLERDAAMARDAGVDVVFAPHIGEMYPAGLDAYREERSVRVRAGERSRGFCGAKRPGHFDGVVHIVSVLFNIVQPDVAVFGEKDYQQLQVIREMVRDLHYGTEILAAPLIRDASGIALSSRNALLGDRAQAALGISRALHLAADRAAGGEEDVEVLRKLVRSQIEQAGLCVDYVEIVDVESLAPLTRLGREGQMLAAAFAGDVRLIDNIRLRHSS